MDKIITLHDREIIELHSHPNSPNIRHFGITLSSSEAIEYLVKGLRVFGDEDGPFLVVRIGRNCLLPIPSQGFKYDVTFRALSWTVSHTSGVICWLESYDAKSALHDVV